jgi:hypothetical protein
MLSDLRYDDLRQKKELTMSINRERFLYGVLVSGYFIG